MSTNSITVQNGSGQVASFHVEGPNDPTARILEERIQRGELKKVSKGTKTERVVVAVVDADTGVKDERGDLLKSVHGGGLDPDADGDVAGQPSGSKPIDGAIEVDGVSEAAIAQAEAKPQSAPAKKAAAAKKAASSNDNA